MNHVIGGHFGVGCRQRMPIAALAFAIAAICLLQAGAARGDLATNLQLHDSMSAVTPYVPPAYWEDVSGNDHVSLVNTPSYNGGGNRATGVDFVGDDGAKRILVKDGSVADLDPGTTDYSVSLWYNETTSEAYNYLLTKGNSNSSATGGYSLATVNGVPTLRVNDVSEIDNTPPKLTVASSGGALPTGSWHHLVAVFDRTGTVSSTPNTVQLYVDNAPPSSGLLVSPDFMLPYDVRCPNAAYQPLCIGGRNNAGSNDFEGYMDDVAVYRGALSATDVDTLYRAENLTATTITTAGITPVVVHNFVANRDQPEVMATVPDDYDSHSGTIYNGAKQATDATRGKVLEFDGTPSSHTEYVKYGDVLDPMSGSYTAVLWCKLNNTGTTGEVVAGKGMKQSTGNEGWSIFLSQSDPLNPAIQVRGNYDGTTTNRLKLFKPLAFDDRWHHVALVIDRANGVLKGYLDGQGSGISGAENGWTVGSGYYNTIPAGVDFDSPEDLILGTDSLSYPIDGWLDDFAIWTRALSDAEILDLYNGVPFPSPNPIPGDATGDKKVDAADAQRLALYWGATELTSGLTWWQMGDFDNSLSIGAGDASILAANWGHGVGESSSLVPEPGTLTALLGIAAMVLLARRNK